MPPEQLVALVTAMRDHLLASAPGESLPADAPAPSAQAAGRKAGKRRGRAAAVDPSEQVCPRRSHDRDAAWGQSREDALVQGGARGAAARASEQVRSRVAGLACWLVGRSGASWSEGSNASSMGACMHMRRCIGECAAMHCLIYKEHLETC